MEGVNWSFGVIRYHGVFNSYGCDIAPGVIEDGCRLMNAP